MKESGKINKISSIVQQRVKESAAMTKKDNENLLKKCAVTDWGNF